MLTEGFEIYGSKYKYWIRQLQSSENNCQVIRSVGDDNVYKTWNEKQTNKSLSTFLMY